ncbi:neurotrophin 1 [Daphnia magna]|uniref:neurotrophin 1 n=1 Tax=Daphnia magna TaxID=35525 RepID=UPI0014026B1A|nr:neurotrophin 1 [Daphnia magna]
MSFAVAILLFCAVGTWAEDLTAAEQYRPSYKPEYPAYKPAYPEPQYPSYSKPSYPSYPSYPAHPAYPKYCDPKAAPKCAENSTGHWCLTDEEYPVYEVKYAIDYDPLVLKKYADVADQSAKDLVDGISKEQEEKFDYSFYNGKQFDEGNWVGGEGFICPSDVAYSRPLRAKNTAGEWRVIVQDIAWPTYTQTQRTETCLFPEAACRTLAPCHFSKCLQKHTVHRMLSFDPCDAHKGIFIDTYKLPSACSCHIPVKA